MTTAFRFHPGELLLSALLRVAQVLLVGAGPGVVVVWEIVTNGATAFHHSNWRLPVALERALVRVLVTPRMHGIHHSVVEREANTNWSVIVTWWDRLHRTLRLDVPQDAVVIGLPAYRDPAELRFPRLLALPFRLRPTWPLPSASGNSR